MKRERSTYSANDCTRSSFKTVAGVYHPGRIITMPASQRPATARFESASSRWRGAISTLEVLVSLTLLMTVLKYSLPLIVRHGHLLVEQRHYRVALDELSNQLDRLTGMPPGDVPQALKILSPSPFAAAHLTAAKLSADLKPADIGQRITLSLAWNDPHKKTISMAGWIFPPAGRSANTSSSQP